MERTTDEIDDGLSRMSVSLFQSHSYSPPSLKLNCVNILCYTNQRERAIIWPTRSGVLDCLLACPHTCC